jgi:hypothetical protein
MKETAGSETDFALSADLEQAIDVFRKAKPKLQKKRATAKPRKRKA